MSVQQSIIMIAINIALKLGVAFLAYTVAVYFGAPMWLVIALTAIGAVETKLEVK